MKESEINEIAETLSQTLVARKEKLWCVSYGQAFTNPIPGASRLNPVGNPGRFTTKQGAEEYATKMIATNQWSISSYQIYIYEFEIDIVKAMLGLAGGITNCLLLSMNTLDERAIRRAQIEIKRAELERVSKELEALQAKAG